MWKPAISLGVSLFSALLVQLARRQHPSKISFHQDNCDLTPLAAAVLLICVLYEGLTLKADAGPISPWTAFSFLERLWCDIVSPITSWNPTLDSTEPCIPNFEALTSIKLVFYFFLVLNKEKKHFQPHGSLSFFSWWFSSFFFKGKKLQQCDSLSPWADSISVIELQVFRYSPLQAIPLLRIVMGFYMYLENCTFTSEEASLEIYSS